MPILDITPQEARDLIGRGHQLIDVREPDEYAQVRAEGAVNLPLSEFEARFREIDPARPAVLICRSGARSRRAAEYLAAQGYDEAQLLNLAGGTEAWVAGDLPHTSGAPRGEG